MTHSRTSRRVALLATVALVGSAFAATPVAAQDLNVCDGEFEGPVTLEVTVLQGSHPEVYRETVDAFNAGPGAEQGVTVDPDERRQIIWDMQKKIFADRPYIILAYRYNVEAYRGDRFKFVEDCGDFTWKSCLLQAEVLD